MLVEHEHSATNYKTIYLEGEKKVFMCKQCPNEFFDDIEFKQHLLSHKQDEMIRFKCGKCGLQSKDDTSFAEHGQVHDRLAENHCPICMRDMKSNKNLRSHVKCCNNKDAMWQCDMCGKLMLPGKMSGHILRFHTEITEHLKCNQCDKIFRLPTDLQKHLRVHSGIKPHPCSICGKRFLAAGNMREHMRIHDKAAQEKSKIHSCTFCQKAFVRKYLLRVHMEKHHSIMESS